MKIAVVALGKIGLPLAVQFANKGHHVMGCDVNQTAVDLINAGTEPFQEKRIWMNISKKLWHLVI